MRMGQIDGINSRIKVIRRMACGFRGTNYFFL
ncbi:MAG: transposase [Aquabacterium sp.]